MPTIGSALRRGRFSLLRSVALRTLSRKELHLIRKSARFCLKIQILESAVSLISVDLGAAKFCFGRADFWLFLQRECRDDHKMANRPFYGCIPKVVDSHMVQTSLLHHLNVDLLRDSFYALKHKASPGVDGVTWQEYETGLKDRIIDLHSRVHRGTY